MDYFFGSSVSQSPEKKLPSLEKRNSKEDTRLSPRTHHLSSREATPGTDTKKRRRRGRHRNRGSRNRDTPPRTDADGAIATQLQPHSTVDASVGKYMNQSSTEEPSRVSPSKFGCDSTKGTKVANSKNIRMNYKKMINRSVKRDRVHSANCSWLDLSLGEEAARAPDNPRECVAVPECKRESNVQLNAYKNRFTFGRNSADLDAHSNVLNNEKDVKKDTAKIGVNVNKFDEVKNKKFDGMKRSRRKTEPFDFELQDESYLDGDISLSFSDLDCKDDNTDSMSPTRKGLVPNESNRKDTSHTHSALNGVSGELLRSDNVSNGNAIEPCSKDKNTEDLAARNPTDASSKRSLFSGSITDTGLFVKSVISELESSERDSLQRIFDEDCDLNASDEDNDLDSDSGSDDVDFDSDDGRYRNGDGVLLPPEPQIGNVEYKLKLVNPTKQRFEHLVTQMKWRLREGRGEAVYGLGVRDCGRLRGLPWPRLRASLRTLRRMAARLGAQCALLAVLRANGRYGAEVMVRKIPDDQHNIEVRVAVMGSNDAGKSTLVGVLTQGELDNGRGSARLNMFRHLHEVRTGRTSSVSHEALGFDAQGRPINYASSDLITPEEILERSSKLVSFIDLAGHRKYLKTTVQGLTGYCPHLAMLVVSGTGGVNRMTLEHLALVSALDLPFFLVVTKVDRCPPAAVEAALRQELTRAGCRKVPLAVRTRDDVVLAASSVGARVAVPLFPVSCVTGAGLDALRLFLFLAPSTNISSEMEQEAVEFQVDETFKVGDSSGPVVAGLLTKGVITERTKLLIGPLDSGEFMPIRVDSLHRNKVPCRVVRAGQAASLGLSWPLPGLRQGMVLLAIPDRYPHSTTIPASPNVGTTNKLESYSMANGNSALDGSGRVKLVVNEQCQRDKILSEGAWKSEKVSPKACKKLRKKLGIDLKQHSTDSTFQNDNSNANSLADDELKNTNLLSAEDLELIIKEVGCKNDLHLGVNLKSRVEVGDSLQEGEGKEDENRNSKDEDSDDGSLEEDPQDPRGCFFFQATVTVLHNSTAIYPGFQATVHIGSIRQTAVIEGILSSQCVLGAGERASVLFRFLRHPEYVRRGSRLLLRQALHTKAVGCVTQAFPHRS